MQAKASHSTRRKDGVEVASKSALQVPPCFLFKLPTLGLKKDLQSHGEGFDWWTACQIWLVRLILIKRFSTPALNLRNLPNLLPMIVSLSWRPSACSACSTAEHCSLPLHLRAAESKSLSSVLVSVEAHWFPVLFFSCSMVS